MDYGIDWRKFVNTMYNQLKKQNLMLEELSEKVDKLTEASKICGNNNDENTDLLKNELTSHY